MSIQPGLTARAEAMVTAQNTADTMGSGLLPVFATPAMIALMENAASNAVISELEPGQSTVGTLIQISHDSATPVGMKVYAEATLVEVDRKRLVFEVAAYDEVGLIGKGRHERFIIDIEKFMAKTNGKANIG